MALFLYLLVCSSHTQQRLKCTCLKYRQISNFLNVSLNIQMLSLSNCYNTTAF